ncbi:hypothetical protein CAPTEDRAFT_218838 [Capitella teleta]|uniref:protein xylosyltransferase n=1 Tax=Capitella teleta TaxID=283909 RepID=R7TR12_CAPTE|nr:hypothetical protein CAPTEDRAFT_218838 [Capitella teleta]|eukprot:ELT93931.1 hypothetical protein CAPTEDRAFT_218838 [Capitella teleta]
MDIYLALALLLSMLTSSRGQTAEQKELHSSRDSYQRISFNLSSPENLPWTNVVCPKGYFISSISYAFNRTAIVDKNKSEFLWDPDIAKLLQLDDVLLKYKEDRTIDLPKSSRDEEFLVRLIETERRQKSNRAKKRQTTKANTLEHDHIRESNRQQSTIHSSPGPNIHFVSSKIDKREYFLSPSKPRQDWEDVLKSARDNYERRQRNQSLDIQVAESDFGPCPTLLMCLGYQACVFHLSTEFCRGDPVPLFRKQLDMNVVCEQDAAFPTRHAPHGAEKLYEEVVYLKYDSKLEIPLRQYESTQIHPVVNKESEIFDVKCPDVSRAFASGYRGNCTATPSNKDNSSNELWFKLAKSFTTAWGSYDILRAILEGMEWLLRLGHWDHAIVISGSDLPVRTVGDMMLALAPYRGHSFLGFYDINEEFSKWNYARDNIWLTCEGFTHSLGSRRSPSNLKSYAATSWSIYARNFISAILERPRDELFDKMQWFLQTTFIPDEAFLATLTHINSSLRQYVHHWKLYWSKPFVGENIDGLCRHTLHADSCQGPGILYPQDVTSLKDQSHHTFFSRKFSADPEDIARKEVLNIILNDEFGAYLREQTPAAIMELLIKIALNKMAAKYSMEFKMIQMRNFRSLPRLQSADPGCYWLQRANFNRLHEFFYIIEFEVIDAHGQKLNARALMAPRHPLRHQCFCDGDLRVLYVSSTPSNRDLMNFAYSVPHDPYSDTLHLAIGLDMANTTLSCSGLKSELIPARLVNQTIGNKVRSLLEFEILLLSPGGIVECRKTRVVEHTHGKENPVPEHRHIFFHFEIPCSIREVGYWTVSVSEVNRTSAFVYNATFLVVDTSEPVDIAQMTGILETLKLQITIYAFPTPLPDIITDNWKVENVAVINEKRHESYYSNVERDGSIPKAEEHVDQPSNKTLKAHSRQPQKKRTATSWIWITLVVIVILDMFWGDIVGLVEKLKGRIRRKLSFYALLVVCALALDKLSHV